MSDEPKLVLSGAISSACKPRSGYRHSLYAQSLCEFGLPRYLEHSGGWLLERAVPNTDVRDAIGCYPRFFCDDWKGLPEDLASLSGDLVSCTLVTDPFDAPPVEELKGSFHIVHPFKEHFVVDLALPLEQSVKSSHRANARKALRSVQVRVCAQPAARLADWNVLYGVLVQRHVVTGLRAFSPAAFALQLAIPGRSTLHRQAANPTDIRPTEGITAGSTGAASRRDLWVRASR